ncbi:alkaline phosphatase [Corynebacterium breve]|uniref:Alkaline phosphatase n=1 Tax=Corynebacterium breve TaxID=3049799 RepID=A0ABY8VJR5_9CORY|nr:alkaline phosphatase [Corynebacterium breve]WIM67820.1 alkaline phosphatase [Corynebacterium breve]
MSSRKLRHVLIASFSTLALTVAAVPAAGALSSLGSSSSGLDWFSSSPGVEAPQPTASAPKNIIYLIGDGMGYDHVAAANFYQTGDSRYQVEGPAGSELAQIDAPAVQKFEGDDWNELGMTSFQHGNSYDGKAAWSDHNYVNLDTTDSAAAGTAMATGVKTVNGMLGVDPNNAAQENTSERAKDNEKAAGVVSSVPFSHATPAAWAVHTESRNDYQLIADQMINSELDVVFGAGNPHFDDNAQRIDTPDYKYISEGSFNKLANGETDWAYVEEDVDFEALAAGKVEDKDYFGIAQAGSTLQQGRAGESVEPYDVPFNDVVDLETMTLGALNVLSQDEDGFHLMVEGGAIDWAGHANDIARDIEETEAFIDAANAVIDWVETNSSWEETLVIVTADHETGYLSAAGEDPDWKAMTGEAGKAPNHAYYSGNHTNELVPFYFKGAGSEDILAATTGTDPVRGNYVDNVTVAQLTLNKWWARD